jgi:hypothetical protein
MAKLTAWAPRERAAVGALGRETRGSVALAKTRSVQRSSAGRTGLGAEHGQSD